jgi:hypothetical protein
MRVSGQRHVPAALHQDGHGTHCIGGCVGHRASLHLCGISCPTGIRSPNRLARSESLHRLSHPGPHLMSADIKNDPINPPQYRFYKLFIIVIGREKNADFSATNGIEVLELCPNVLNSSFSRFMFPCESCRFLHPFYLSRMCIPSTVLSYFKWGTDSVLRGHFNCMYGR